MIAAESTDVLDPVRGSLHRSLSLTAEDLGCLHDAFLVRLVSQYFVNVVEQLIGCEVMQVHRQTEAFALETYAIVRLVTKQRKSYHRNAVVDSFILSVGATVGDEESSGRMREDFVLW